MAFFAFYVFGMLRKKLGDLSTRIISGIVAEIVMILGYYIFEGFLYGFIAAFINVPANAMQGVAGIVIGTILMKAIEKSTIKFE